MKEDVQRSSKRDRNRSKLHASDRRVITSEKAERLHTAHTRHSHLGTTCADFVATDVILRRQCAR